MKSAFAHARAFARILTHMPTSTPYCVCDLEGGLVLRLCTNAFTTSEWAATVQLHDG